MTCTEPGCGGDVVDGYCMICGMPPSVGSSGSSSASSRASAPASGSSGSGSSAADLANRTINPAPHPSAVPSPAAPQQQRPTPPSQASPGRQSGPVLPQPSAASAGSAASAPPAPGPRGPVPGSRPGAAKGRCGVPGCGGEIRDGYCDICGSPPGAGPVDDDAGLTSSTKASSQIASTALGSALVGTAQARRSRVSSRSRSARIGAGLTRVPAAPPVDPSQALMQNPVVPESRRLCPSCGAKVGRSNANHEGRTAGFCAKCRNPFSFEPQLQPGDLVGQQYEVAGCLAHGGMGWLYLAKDRNVSDRWVVLKGILNSGDADAVAAAIAEQQFLAQVEHPSIVEIYNFVTHAGAGYIVMEYVGGRSLKDLLKDRREANGGVYYPLPVDQALAYLIEVLPAFDYLHEKGLVYCDFKPDNVIQVDDSIKLIDLGGVRRMDDEESAIYGTVGYQAPEIARQGPSVASDIFTIGRTLMVLCSEFRGYQTTHEFSLPAVEDTPLFQENDSLYRLLLKCCAPNPADRFQSAAELKSQLMGVLRETVARRTSGTALTSAPSELFEAPVIVNDSVDWHQLPALRPDPDDRQHAWLANIDIEDPADRLAALDTAPEATVEVWLHRCVAALELGDMRRLDAAVRELLHLDPWEWRALWMQGLGAMAQQRWPDAMAAFNAVYGEVPGELAPKLALAVACEHAGEPDVAEDLYLTCVATDANYVTISAFGLARIREQRDDLSKAVSALDMVPTTSRAYAEARRVRARHLLKAGGGLTALGTALDSMEGVRMAPGERERFEVTILEQALEEVQRHGPSKVRIGPWRAEPNALRVALEGAYRKLARFDTDHRVELVDKANRTRRWSLL